MEDATRRQNEERERVAKLTADLDEEKKRKDDKKVREREAAMKVIKDNMVEKKKRMAELDAIKKAETEQIEKNMRMQLEKEKARED